MKGNKEQLVIWDPIEGAMEDCDSEEDFEKYVRKNYIDCCEIHPDVEMVELLVKRRFVVYDEETGKLVFQNF